MPEWTIEISSAAPAEDVEEAVERVAVSLEASAALGPSISGNLVDGTVSATYQVEADDRAAALHAGGELFLEALLLAGIDPSIGTCEVRPAGVA